MNETAERRQGAENACQRLRRKVLTATAALAAAALVFGWRPARCAAARCLPGAAWR